MISDNAAEATTRKRSEGISVENSNLIGLAGIVALLWGVFAVLAPGFASSFSSFALLRSVSTDVVIGFSTMVVLATGGMNLSIGSIGACSAMLAGYLLQVWGAPIPLAITAGLTLGTLLGFANGIAIVKTGVSSFIITLASASIFFGGMVLLTKGEIYNTLPQELAAFPRLRLGILSPLVFITLTASGALIVLFRYTAIGREILSTGANADAAALSGVRVNVVIVLVHSLSGFLAGFASMMVMARDGAAMPSIGHDWLLTSFLAPVLGGTLLMGGYVSVVGTILGALLVVIIRTGLLALDVGSYWLQLFLGLLLLMAVLLERFRKIRAEKRRMGA